MDRSYRVKLNHIWAALQGKLHDSRYNTATPELIV